MVGWHAEVVWSLVAERTTWRLRGPDGELRYLKLSPHGADHSLAEERDRLVWAGAHLPVPAVLEHGTDDSHQWLITAGIDGVSAVDEQIRSDPPRLVPLLGQALRQLHSAPWRDCPFDGRLDTALPLAHSVFGSGGADPNFTFARHGGISARDALALLERTRPEAEDLVVCHGDYCVPNVLVRDWQLAGFVDLGALAVADRWRDLAIALWSIGHNMGPGWDNLFLESYEIERDPAKIAYYHLLYDLLP
jgi:aminoglycoside phosphotransferase